MSGRESFETTVDAQLLLFKSRTSELLSVFFQDEFLISLLLKNANHESTTTESDSNNVCKDSSLPEDRRGNATQVKTRAFPFPMSTNRPAFFHGRPEEVQGSAIAFHRKIVKL